MWAPIACLHEADGRRRPQCVLWDVWVSDPGGASLEGEPQGAQGRASEEGRAREGGSTPLPSGNLAVAHLSRPMRPPPAPPRAWACPPGQTPQAHQPKVRVVGAPGLSAGLRRGRRPSSQKSSRVAVSWRLQASVWSVGSHIPTGVTVASSTLCPSWVPVISGHSSPLRSPPPQPACGQEACRVPGPSTLASLCPEPSVWPLGACRAASG